MPLGPLPGLDDEEGPLPEEEGSPDLGLESPRMEAARDAMKAFESGSVEELDSALHRHYLACAEEV